MSTSKKSAHQGSATGQTVTKRSAGPPVVSLVSRALSVLASRRVGQTGGLSEPFLHALTEAVKSSDQDMRDRVVRDMIVNRISKMDIADLYIPEVARRMGTSWCEDTLSFAEVTIGSARLQGMLHDLTEDWSMAPRTASARGPNVVVLVIADEYHTLGPLLLTSQLRRLGVSVRLMLGRPDAEIRALLGERRFDAVLVSLARREMVDKARELVAMIRKVSDAKTPIVVGGPILDHDIDVQALTGADFVSFDVREAMSMCGLVEQVPKGAHPAPDV